MPFLLIFLFFPVAEIAVFILMGQEIGLGSTLLLVFLTAVAGMALIGWQGETMRRKAREALASRQPVLEEAIGGICTVIGGMLLIVPGFLTDALGLALALPGLQLMIARGLQRVAAANGHVVFRTGSGPGPKPGPKPGQGPDMGPGGPPGGAPGRGAAPVIEGDYTVVEEPGAGSDTKDAGEAKDGTASDPRQG